MLLNVTLRWQNGQYCHCYWCPPDFFVKARTCCLSSAVANWSTKLAFICCCCFQCCSWVPIGTAIQIFQTEGLEENRMIQLCCLIMDYIPNNIIDQTFYVYSEAILAARDKPHCIMPVKNNWTCYSILHITSQEQLCWMAYDYSKKSNLAIYSCSY